MPSLARRPAETPFPKDFKAVCKNIFKRLLRVFAHVYIHHFDKIVGTSPDVRREEGGKRSLTN